MVSLSLVFCSFLSSFGGRVGLGVLVAFAAITAFFVVSRRRSRDNLNRFGNSNGRVTPESEMLDAVSATAAAARRNKAVNMEDDDDNDDDDDHLNRHQSTRRFRSLVSDPEAAELKKANRRPGPGERIR